MGLAHSPRIVTNGLVLCLDAGNTKSYPGSGTTWTDISGRGNNGTLTNGPTFSSDNKGSIVFDGTDDYTVIGRPAIVPSFTLSVWIRWNGGGNSWQGIMTRGRDTALSWYGIWLYRPTASIVIGGAGNLNSASSISSGVWYNVTSTLQPSGTIIYLNGIINATTTSYYSSSEPNSDLVIGRALGVTEYFYGRIASGLIYNRALSATEIAQNFNALRGRFGI